MKKFTGTTTIGEVIKTDEKYIKVLMEFGMHCFGCPMSQMETLAEAAEAHGIDIDFMLKKLNEAKK